VWRGGSLPTNRTSPLHLRSLIQQKASTFSPSIINITNDNLVFQPSIGVKSTSFLYVQIGGVRSKLGFSGDREVGQLEYGCRSSPKDIDDFPDLNGWTLIWITLRSGGFGGEFVRKGADW